MDKTFRKNLLKQLSIAVLILAVLFGGLYFIKNHIKESVAQVMSSRQELKNRTATINTLSKLRSQYRDKGKAYLNVLSNIIPAKDKLINVSQDFQSIAQSSDLGFGFSFAGEKTPEDDSELGYIEFRLNVTGETMDEISEFISNIENFQYLTVVDSVNIRRNKDKNQIELTLQGKVYFQ